MCKECTNCGSVEFQDVDRFNQIIRQIVVKKVSSEINAYNKNLYDSDDYKKRLLEIENSDAICTTLQSAIDTLKQIDKKNSNIYYLESRKNDRSNTVIELEYPTVKISEYWEKEKELEAKILTLDILDYESTITMLVNWYKDLCELHI